MIDWPSYNRSLIRRREILFPYNLLDVWDLELMKMNKSKEDKKYKYPESFIEIIGHIRIHFHLSYIQTEEGIIRPL